MINFCFMASMCWALRTFSRAENGAVLVCSGPFCVDFGLSL